MKKRNLLSIAALSIAVIAGSTSIAAQAAPAKIQVQGGKGYYMVSGQSLEELEECLRELGFKLENGEIVCPELPGGGLPDMESPELPSPEVPDIPEAPEMPELPENPSPELPEEPSPELPEEEALTYAEQVVRLVNEERAKAGLSALTMDTKVTAAANVRAKEIKQSFSHTRPDGTGFSTALKEQGVSYRGSGENIAWGQRSPEEVMNGWMNSAGHRANILNSSFKNIGVGYYEDAQGTKHWVQLFTY
ncbi:MAG: CAP domain-containing protein [Clostridiales bacterium]|nr:CAP domain-containing protein [Clostridiales bacterium]